MSGLIFLMLACCWLISDHFPPWTAFHTEVPAFLAAASALVACCRRSDYPGIKLTPAIGMVLALIVTVVLQWIGGKILYGGDALIASIYLITFAAAWVWGYQLATRDSKINLLEQASGFLLFVGLLTTFQAIAQFLHVEATFYGWVLDGPVNGRAYANVGQPNQAATVLLMGTVGAAILMLRGRIGQFVMWCAVLLLGVALTLTQSRTALLSATLIAILYVVCSPRAKEHGISRTSIFLWVLFIYLSAWGFQYLEVNEIKAGIGVDRMVAPGSRFLLWHQLIAGLMQSPWIGFGWLQIAAGQQAGSLIVPGPEQTNFAHNIVLDLFVVLGIPLACLVLGLAGWWWFRRARPITQSADAAAAFFLLLPLLIHSLLEFPHAYAYFLFVGGLLLGGIDAWTQSSKTIFLTISKPLLFVFAMIWTVLLVGTAYEYALAEEDFRVNRFENRRLGETPGDYRPPDLVLLTQLEGMLKGMRLRAKPGMSTEDIDSLVKISKRYSWAPLQFRTALALALNDRFAEATQQLRVIKGSFSESIYAEAKENLIRMRRDEYPQLDKLELP